MTGPSTEQQRQARVALLKYFAEGGHTISSIPNNVAVEGFTADELQDMARALVELGLLQRARGRTRGQVYVITKDGRVMLLTFRNQD